MPMVCSVVLTGWITFCLWLSLLERTPGPMPLCWQVTPRAGWFSSGLWPVRFLTSPSFEVQEIAIGIFCAAVIHRYVLPARISAQFNALSQTLRTVRERVADTWRQTRVR